MVKTADVHRKDRHEPDTGMAIANVLKQALTVPANTQFQPKIWLATLDFDHREILHLTVGAIVSLSGLQKHPGANVSRMGRTTDASPTTAPFLSCIGHPPMLGTKAKKADPSPQSAPPPKRICARFYAPRKLAPFQSTGQAQFHHKTFVPLLLGVE